MVCPVFRFYAISYNSLIRSAPLLKGLEGFSTKNPVHRHKITVFRNARPGIYLLRSRHFKITLFLSFRQLRRVPNHARLRKILIFTPLLLISPETCFRSSSDSLPDAHSPSQIIRWPDFLSGTSPPTSDPFRYLAAHRTCQRPETPLQSPSQTHRGKQASENAKFTSELWKFRWYDFSH